MYFVVDSFKSFRLGEDLISEVQKSSTLGDHPSTTGLNNLFESWKMTSRVKDRLLELKENVNSALKFDTTLYRYNILYIVYGAFC